MTIALKKVCLRTYNQMKSDRQPYEAGWRDLSDQCSPKRLRFETTDRGKDNRSTKQIINNTSLIAARTLVSGLQSGMTSPGRPWFHLFVPNLKSRVSEKWLEDVTEIIRETFIRSNVYQALPILYHDVAIYGSSAASLDEDNDSDIRIRNFALGSWCISSNQRNQVDMFMREVALRVREMVDEFGKENCSEKVQKEFENGRYENLHDVVQIIMPSGLYKKYSVNKPYISVHYEKCESNTEKFLRISGFEEFPILAPRWEIIDEDTYGFGPGSLALGDAKALQLYEKMSALAVEKMVDPPMMGPSHLAGRGFSLEPGAYNPVDLRDVTGVKSVYDMRFPVNEARQAIAEHVQRINEAFFVDLFVMLSNLKGQQPLTAREVDERHEEKLLMLGPVWERLNDELLGPLIQRTFNILWRRGKLPPVPQELQGAPFRIEYSSVMAHAMKMVGLTNVDRFMQNVLVIAGVKPDILYKVNMEELVDHQAKVLGVPVDIVVDTKEAQAKSQAVEQMKMQQAQLEQSKLASEAAKNSATAAAQAPQGLDQLLQAAGG